MHNVPFFALEWEEFYGNGLKVIAESKLTKTGYFCHSLLNCQFDFPVLLTNVLTDFKFLIHLSL